MSNQEQIRVRLGFLSKLLSISCLISFLVLLRSNSKREELPAENEILPALKEEPVQEKFDDRAFTLRWRSSDYVLHPVAKYEISGLVVSRNDIGGFTDIYHSADSVDVVDVCMLWGANTRERVYRNSEFWSEPFSCWYRPKRNVSGVPFREDELSNTHILPRDENLARELSAIHLGDQIRLRGKLVNYNPAGASEMLRRSSLTRTDQGNGACEVMFVEEFALLKPGNPGWNKLFVMAKKFFLISLFLKILSFLLFPYLEYRYASD